MEEKQPNSPKITKVRQKGKKQMLENKFKGWKEVFMEHALGKTEPVKTNWLRHIELYLFTCGVEVLFVRRNSKQKYRPDSNHWLVVLARYLRINNIPVRVFYDGWTVNL